MKKDANATKVTRHELSLEHLKPMADGRWPLVVWFAYSPRHNEINDQMTLKRQRTVTDIARSTLRSVSLSSHHSNSHNLKLLLMAWAVREIIIGNGRWNIVLRIIYYTFFSPFKPVHGYFLLNSHQISRAVRFAHTLQTLISQWESY